MKRNSITQKRRAPQPKKILYGSHRRTLLQQSPSATWTLFKHVKLIITSIELNSQDVRHWNKKIFFFLFVVFKCGTCGDCFQTANELRTHMKMHNAKPIKQFECIICKMELNTAKLLEKHMQSHGEERKGPVFSTCTVCREYVCEPHLCGEETQIDCAYCQQKYTSTKELITHLGIHSDDCKFYRCAECAKVFRMEFLLKNHEKYHTAHPKAFLCSICAKAFDSNAKLNQHTSTYHSNAATNQGLISQLLLCDIYFLWITS